MRAVVLLFWVAAVLALLFLLLRHRLPAPRRSPAELDELVKDPVCQTYVVRSRAVRQADATGLHYFCSQECARRYAAGA
jgi:YHS domain-containing protein